MGFFFLGVIVYILKVNWILYLVIFKWLGSDEWFMNCLVFLFVSYSCKINFFLGVFYWRLEFCFVFLGLFLVMVFYFLNVCYNICDVYSKNLFGCMGNVWLVFGLDWRFGGLFRFKGCLDSYIEFFNKGCLDVWNFMFIVVWIYLDGLVGLIFNYKFDGFYVYMWLICLWVLLVCFVSCFWKFIVFVEMNLIKLKVWNFVIVMYD